MALHRELIPKYLVQGTIDPAAAAKRRLQRNIAKKESRKRKNDTFM